MMEVYTTLFDDLFETEFLAGEKQPTMMGRSNSIEVGYISYNGFWRNIPRLGWTPDISHWVMEVFGHSDPDIRGSRHRNKSISASVAFSAHKDGDRLYNPTLALKFYLHHPLNVAFFRFTQLLPELDKPDQVAEKIAMLDRTLVPDRDHTGRDHFAELKRVGQQG